MLGLNIARKYGKEKWLVTVTRCYILVAVMVAFAVLDAQLVDGKACDGMKKNEVRVTGCLAKLHAEAVQNISAQEIRKQLRYFTSKPHPPGSAASHQQAIAMKNQWLQYGLDSVELKKYNVMLSLPEQPGSVVLSNEYGDEIFRSAPYEKILEPGENKANVSPPYSAFSKSGSVTGKLVYAFFGRSSDFSKLKERGINVRGNIVIMRYGRGSRGLKVKRAQRNGATGVILYSDPEDFAKKGMDKVYPEYNWMPLTGVRRGSVKSSRFSGDLQTPGQPSVGGIYRRPMNDIESDLPQIPVQPISYGDALPLLKILKGRLPRSYWSGGLPIKYGVEMAQYDLRDVTVTVNTKLVTQNIYNVIGVIRGSEEPDHLVILGNHRDGWVFGAADPSSGTAAMMEVARVLGALVKKGWRPKRTIVLCSWGAEESGLIGSTEWVEEYAKLLKGRAVAYINVDMAVDGNFMFRAKVVPLLERVVLEATKKVPSPNNNETLFDEWLRKSPSSSNPTLPVTHRMGSSSDHAPFYQLIGAPTADLRYTYDKSNSGNPLYHTLHDSFRLMSKLIDPDFKFHQVTARTWAQVTLILVDSVVIPFDVTHYGVMMGKYRDSVRTRYGRELRDNGVTLDPLNDAILKFTRAAKVFEAVVAQTCKTDSVAIGQINERLIQLEKTFINDGSTPIITARPMKRHVLLSPALNLKSNWMAGIAEGILRARNGYETWEYVKLQVSIIVYAIQSAVHVLNLAPI